MVERVGRSPNGSGDGVFVYCARCWRRVGIDVTSRTDTTPHAMFRFEAEDDHRISVEQKPHGCMVSVLSSSCPYGGK